MRRLAPAVILTLILTASACTPSSPPPTPPTWNPTGRAGLPASRPAFTASTSNWWAVLNADPTNGMLTTLDLYRRSGPNGQPAATPTQTVVVGGAVGQALAMTDDVIAIAGKGFEVSVRLIRFDTTTGAWGAGVLVPASVLVAPPTAAVRLAVTGNAVAVGLSDPTSGTDGRVAVQRFSLTPSSIVLGANESLSPDPAWPAADRERFGKELAAETDTLAVAGARNVRIYRSASAAIPFAVDATVGLAPPPAFSSGGPSDISVAVDTSTGSPQLLVGVPGTFLLGPSEPGRAELWARGGAGWSRSVTAVAPQTDPFLAVLWGTSVGLDGGRGIVCCDAATAAGALALQVAVFDAGANREATLGVADLGSLPAGTTQAALVRPVLAGSHVVALAATVTGSGLTTVAANWDRVPPW